MRFRKKICSESGISTKTASEKSISLLVSVRPPLRVKHKTFLQLFSVSRVIMALLMQRLQTTHSTTATILQAKSKYLSSIDQLFRYKNSWQATAWLFKQW